MGHGVWAIGGSAVMAGWAAKLLRAGRWPPNASPFNARWPEEGDGAAAGREAGVLKAGEGSAPIGYELTAAGCGCPAGWGHWGEVKLWG